MTECRRARAQHLRQERLARELQEAESLPRCEECGERFPKRSGPGRFSRFCQQHRPVVLTKESRDELRRSTVKTCPDCGVEFSPEKYIGQSYCSKPCAKRSHNRGRVRGNPTCSEYECSTKSVSLGLCRKHHPDAKSWSKGKPETRRKNLRRKTQLRRALIAGADSEPIDRDEIGARDGWKCGLCGKRVNQSLQWPDPMGASLDHIVPISLGGAHRKENVQISHLGCNMAKGNRGGGEQLLLIG